MSDTVSLRVALCQLNTVVGDIEGNVGQIIEGMARARSVYADIVVFPEMAITGYPAEDLLLKPKFVADNLDALDRIAKESGDCAAFVGYVDRTSTDLFNAAAILNQGKIVGRYHKQILPNYGPFDEQRYFRAGELPNTLYFVRGLRIGVTICEDVWFAEGPIAQQAAGGADLIVNINASPYFSGRQADRIRMLKERVTEAGIPIIYVNQMGGQDELVFDGGSLVMGANGNVVASAGQFVEETLIVDVDVSSRQRISENWVTLPVKAPKSQREDKINPLETVSMDRHAEIYSALVVGTRDYVVKNGFTDVVIALSGGIDSSLVAAIAVDAVGSAHVHGVMMPSRYSSESSISDAVLLADNLGIETRTIAIESAHSIFQQMLEESINGDLEGITDENLQSRIRAVTVMALSNQFGWLVLTTGNKSELAVGYSTLYGDSAGGFAVIKDIPKTLVYELCDWRNRVSDEGVIPANVLTKAPSAELRPDQKDEDSLPAYEILDPILEAYVENDQTVSEIVDRGFEPDLVRRIIRMVNQAEYKRRQSPIGVRVSPKAFGKDRRVPITNSYSERDSG